MRTAVRKIRLRLSRHRPIRDTLQIMTGLVRKHRDDRTVRDVALRVTSGCPPVNDRCRMARLLGYVKASMRYERDPRGGELIHDGADTLERLGAYGEAAGDCDDAAVCLSTMLESL